MDGWPRSWRSLTWMALAVEAIYQGCSWIWRQVTHQFDPKRKY